MVKIERTENFLYFRTIKRSEKQIKKSPGSFAVPRHAISNLDGTTATLSDGGCYAKLWLDPMEKEVVITFSWLHEHSDGTLIGWRQTVRLPYEKLVRFDDEAYDSGACNVLRLLSRDFLPKPQLVFKGCENLRAVVAIPMLRHKLFACLRNHFDWKSSRRILLYNDSAPFSFFFEEELKNGKSGICGGVILQGWNTNRAKAHYEVHT